MDFTLDEHQRELRRLAAELLGRETTVERLVAHERAGAPYDIQTWKALAQAGLLGVCLPEDVGGAGFSAVELAVILREAGAHVAPVPLLSTLALGALPLAAHGTPEQRERLSSIVAGEEILTAAIREPGETDPARPSATARHDGGGFLLQGVKTAVPYAAEAGLILIPARVEGEGVGVFLAEPQALRLDPHPAATGEPMFRLALGGLRLTGDALLGGTADGAAATTLRRCALAGATAVVSGVLDTALRLTTEHVRTREQFGRPLAQFQAVTMQVGDVYIAKRTLDVAMWAGVWRLAEGHPETDEVLTVAALGAAGPALQALYTCQHLHGGLGLDVRYPLHRYFAWGKHYAHLLGGTEAQLDALADVMDQCSST